MFDTNAFLAAIGDKQDLVVGIRIHNQVAIVYMTRPVALPIQHDSIWNGYCIQYRKKSAFLIEYEFDPESFVLARKNWSGLTET